MSYVLKTVEGVPTWVEETFTEEERNKAKQQLDKARTKQLNIQTALGVLCVEQAPYTNEGYPGIVVTLCVGNQKTDIAQVYIDQAWALPPSIHIETSKAPKGVIIE